MDQAWRSGKDEIQPAYTRFLHPAAARSPQLALLSLATSPTGPSKPPAPSPQHCPSAGQTGHTAEPALYGALAGRVEQAASWKAWQHLAGGSRESWRAEGLWHRHSLGCCSPLLTPSSSRTASPFPCQAPRNPCRLLPPEDHSQGACWGHSDAETAQTAVARCGRPCACLPLLHSAQQWAPSGSITHFSDSIKDVRAHREE